MAACAGPPQPHPSPRSAIAPDAAVPIPAPLPPASAAPDPETPDAAEPALTDQRLSLRWSESRNRHWAGARGADHANHAGRVSLAIFADGRCNIADTGKRVDSVLDGDWHEERTTEWSTSWQGKCRITRGQLRIELARAGTGTCKKSVARRRGAQRFAPEKEPCTLAERLSLACDSVEVEIAPLADDPSDARQRAAVWDCHPVDESRTEGVGSPYGWAFGKDRCLETTGGGPSSGPLRYAACAP